MKGLVNLGRASVHRVVDNWTKPGAHWHRCGRSGFAAQPYQQLALAYRQPGHEGEAREIGIARHRDLRRYGGLRTVPRLTNWLLDRTINFGYRPLRAVGLLAAVYVAAFLLSWYGQHQDAAIVPTDMLRAGSSTASQCMESRGYPCFCPAGYAVDIVVPIVEIGQADHWRVNEHAPWGGLRVSATWVATGLGWAFSTLAVASYTGLVRRE